MKIAVKKEINRGLVKQSKKTEKEVCSNLPITKFKSGISGFDSLFSTEIPSGSVILLKGASGIGKTIFSLNILFNQLKRESNCLFISLKESKDIIHSYMKNFGWKPEFYENKGLLKIIEKESSTFSTNIEVMLARARGELIVDINEILEIIPAGFRPDFIVIDSITAISSTFPDQDSNYRIFLEQFFKYLKSKCVTSFLISETVESCEGKLSSNAEEFLADGIISFYSFLNKYNRKLGVEILKMRGTKHLRRIVPFEITSKGIVVYNKKKMV